MVMAVTIGNEGGGGGIGFLCNENGKQKIYLADTYELHKQGLFNQFTGQTLIHFDTAVEIIDRRYPERRFNHPYIPGQKVTLGYMLAWQHNRLYFERYSNHVKVSGDDNISPDQIPPGCEKFQLAHQNLQTGVVAVQRLGYEPWPRDVYLTRADWFYLHLHEALIALRNRPGADTTEIRQMVRELAELLSDPKNFSLDVLRELAYRYEGKKAVPFSEQTRQRTLYYAPKELTCTPTWSAPRSDAAGTGFVMPSEFKFIRKEGDGRIGEHNKYEMIWTKYRLGLFPYTETFETKKTFFFSMSYNLFGEPESIGEFNLSMAIQTSQTAEMELSINRYDTVTGEYLATFKLKYPFSWENRPPMSNYVVELDTGYGLSCFTNELPEFRRDERSRIYGERI